MHESPLADSPYVVLGVVATASATQLRAAYRRKLRETHPDTGGDARRFHLVQRAWELVGTLEARAAYDAGLTPDAEPITWAPPAPVRRTSTRPPARAHGEAGRRRRDRYVEVLRDGMPHDDLLDPYDPRVVRSAPVAARQLLATAIAEEQTAEVLGGLGIGFTIWHDVGADPADAISHVVLGPTGLWAMLSDDFGGAVAVRQGDLTAPELHPDDRPFGELARRARAFERIATVTFSALVIVVGDGESSDGVLPVGTARGASRLLVQRPRLAHLVRTGLPGVGIGGTDLFEVRTRVQSAVQRVTP